MENIQNINIQDFTLQFKHHSRVYPNYAKFTSLLSKGYPYSSYIYRINSKTQIRLKPNSSKLHTFLLTTIITSISQQHHKNNFSPQFHILIFHPNFLQLSTLLKSLQMTNQTLVPHSSKTLQITLQYYLLDTLVILKFQ